MPSTSFARPRPSARFALLGAASALLAACSVINHFDDVKPDISGAPGAGGGTGGGGGSDGTGMTGGAGPTGGGSAGSAMASDSGTAGSPAGNDSGMGDAAVAPPKLLVCNEVVNTRRKLDDYSTNMNQNDRTLQDRFFMNQLISTNTVRIIAQHGSGTEYLVYYASDGGMSGPAFKVANQGRVLEVHRTSATTTSAFAINDGGMGIGQRFVMHTFDDTTQSNMPRDIVVLTKPGALGTSGNIEGSFAPASDNKIGIFTSYSGGGLNTAAYGLFDTAAGASFPIGFTKLFDDVDANVTRPNSSFRVGAQGSYGFFGEFGSPGGQNEYGVLDGQVPQVRKIQSAAVAAGQSLYVLTSTLNSAGKLNVAIAKADTNTGGLSLLAGQFDATQAMTFSDDKLNLAKQAASFSEVPFGSIPGFLEDNLIFAGPTGSPRTELSILAIDVLGRKRIEQKLWNTTGKISNAAIAPRGTANLVGGKYHVVWSETITDAQGMNGYDVLWYALIECL